MFLGYLPNNYGALVYFKNEDAAYVRADYKVTPVMFELKMRYEDVHFDKEQEQEEVKSTPSLLDEKTTNADEAEVSDSDDDENPDDDNDFKRQPGDSYSNNNYNSESKRAQNLDKDWTFGSNNEDTREEDKYGDEDDDESRQSYHSRGNNMFEDEVNERKSRPTKSKSDKQHEFKRPQRSRTSTFKLLDMLADKDTPPSVNVIEEDPKNHDQAMISKEQTKWKTAETIEWEKMLEMKVFDIVPDNGQVTTGCRFVYKSKHDKDNKVLEWKARLVAQGFSQVEGVNYDDTYAPTLKQESLRWFIYIALKKGLVIYHADVNAAYLNADVHHDIYLRPPKGVVVKGLLHLKKALYGLKQGAKEWRDELEKVMKQLDYYPCTQRNVYSKERIHW
jgi:hypothetical protein